MKSALSLLLVTLLLGTTVAAVAAAPGVTDPNTLQDLAAVRQATVGYQDVAAALDDGYAPVTACVEEPGLGAMGIHYLNPALVGDQAVSLMQPELLLYAPSGSGLRLVGVEYFVVALANSADGPIPWFDHEPPPGGWFTPAPQLFGYSFNGPMEGHDVGMPWHYDFHVWAWQGNPSGLFADFNPTFGCGG